MLGHLTDAERVFSYRAFRISRGDATPLPGFDENPYVDAGNFDSRTVADLLDELHAARASTLALFRHIPPDAGMRRTVVNGVPLTLAGSGPCARRPPRASPPHPGRALRPRRLDLSSPTTTG